MPDPPPFPLANLRYRFPGYSGKVDRWQIIHFQPPSTICLDVGVAKAGTGAPQGDRSQGINGRVTNTISPANDRASSYHWTFLRNWGLTDDALTERTVTGNAAVSAQDEDMLAAQQVAIDAHPDHEFYSLNIDAEGMWARLLVPHPTAARSRSAWASRTAHGAGRATCTACDRVIGCA